MARLMNSTGNIVDIFNLKKEDISAVKRSAKLGS